MQTRPWFAALLALALAGPASAVSILQGPVVSSVNGHTYYLLTSDTWTNSEAYAVTLGGHLATVRSAAENAWIYSTFTSQSTQRALWIGLTDQASPGVYNSSTGLSTGTFAWSSGETVSYTNYSAGQPNNAGNSSSPVEEWVHLWPPNGSGGVYGGGAAGSWNDYQNNTSVDGAYGLYGVAEIVPSTCSGVSTTYVPAQNVFGTLLYEDSFPLNGDLDFNDQVVGYNYIFTSNSDGSVQQLQASFRLLAAGAAFNNGLSLNIPGLTWAGAVKSISLTVNGTTTTPTAPSGETGLVIPLTAQTRALFSSQASPYINTDSTVAAQGTAPALTLVITFKPNTALATASAPYDVYITRASTYTNGTQLQVHKPIFAGTATMDTSVFNNQSYDDRSSGSLHFINEQGLPFALDVPVQLTWMKERQLISTGYSGIVGFMGGAANSSWYTNPTDSTKLFTAGAASSSPPGTQTANPLIQACPNH